MSRPSGQSTDISPVEEWEYDALMPHLARHWQLYYELLWQIGPRAREALAIEKTDIENGGVWIGRLKRKDNKREHLPLTPDLYERLKKYAHYVKGTRVFPYSHSGAWLALKNACVKANIRTTIHPHSFRHSVGYRVAGADLGGLTSLAQQVTVQHVLGQKSLSSASRYFNPPPAKIINAIREINKKVSQPTPAPVPVPPPPTTEIKPPEPVDIISLVKKYSEEA
jgi:integrase